MALLLMRQTDDGRPDPSGPRPVATAHEKASFTIPGQITVAKKSFPVNQGQPYHVSFSMTPAPSSLADGAAAAFIGVRMECRRSDGTLLGQTGGTRNIEPGDATAFTNQMLITADRPTTATCVLHVYNTVSEVSAAGSTIPVEASWTAIAADPSAASAPLENWLPATLQPKDREVAASIILDPRTSGDVTGRSTLHLTTCTILNGSTEGGRRLCSTPGLDDAGSTAALEFRTVALDDSGRVCGTYGRTETRIRISRLRHHELVPLTHRATIPPPNDRCGKELRMQVRVLNEGPADLVVHRANSSLIADRAATG
ncbi:hypothetical protein MHY20_03430 [Helcobacillus sp. ACRRO]|nr:MULTISPECIES: hypothetical protein [Helcobacillus]MCG7426672.1 hypothetical protein [Helcobacillus sp. ACRRO]MCT2035904.1 hypothetical protein [Helcobacillus massiliensis]MCT2331826.1 hypothetical protein [Helcobacillus massiliensis]